MAKYRPIYTKIWSDPDFIEYPPEDKLLFIYLCTNPKTNESGIYTISIRTVANEIGIPYETISKRITNSCHTVYQQINNCAMKNVYYDSINKLIFIKKFLKYNGGGNPAKVRISILNDCKYNPSQLWNLFAEEYPEYHDDIIKQLSNYSQTVTNQLNDNNSTPNPNPNPNPNPIVQLANSLQTVSDDDKKYGEIMTLYENNIGLLTPLTKDELDLLINDYPHDWIIDAIKIANSSNGKNIRYISKVLENRKNGKVFNRKQEFEQPTVKYTPIDLNSPDYLAYKAKFSKSESK